MVSVPRGELKVSTVRFNPKCRSSYQARQERVEACKRNLAKREQKRLDKEIDKIKSGFSPLDEEDSDPDFSSKVVALIGKRKAMFGNNLYECNHCNKGFATKYLLT